MANTHGTHVLPPLRRYVSAGVRSVLPFNSRAKFKHGGELMASGRLRCSGLFDSSCLFFIVIYGSSFISSRSCAVIHLSFFFFLIFSRNNFFRYRAVQTSRQKSIVALPSLTSTAVRAMMSRLSSVFISLQKSLTFALS